jgi:hypothetical protein
MSGETTTVTRPEIAIQVIAEPTELLLVHPDDMRDFAASA